MQHNLAMRWPDPSGGRQEVNKKIPPSHIALVNADLLNFTVGHKRLTAFPIQEAALYRPRPTEAIIRSLLQLPKLRTGP